MDTPSNIKCPVSSITRMELSTADIRSLVTSMVTGVKTVQLGGDVTLDMETLAQYDGRGVCGRVVFYYNTSREGS